MNTKSERETLEEFIHENPELEELEEIVDDFNIFAALEVIHTEIRHSTFLAWLMDPSESHALGDYFLASLLKKLAFKASSLGMEGISVFDIDSWDFDDAEILREWKNIDILIRCDAHRFVCAVENKVSSAEHGDQLARYKATVESEFPEYRRLYAYLTVEGDTPSEEDYVPLSYDEIVSLVETVTERKKDKVGSEILAFISHYKDMLRRYVVEDSEIQEICRKIYKRHKRALDLIFEYKPDKLLEIYECLVDMIENDPDLILDDSSKSYIRFLPAQLDFIPKVGDGWTKTKRMLLFEVNNNPQGAFLYLIIGPGPQEIRKALYDVATDNLVLFNTARRKLTKYWLSVYKKTVIRAKEYADKEQSEIRETIEERWMELKDSDMPRIVSEISTLGRQMGWLEDKPTSDSAGKP